MNGGEYVDVRDIHPDYTTIPCMECETEVFVTLSFAYVHDGWYCTDCKPDRFTKVGGNPIREVRL